MYRCCSCDFYANAVGSTTRMRFRDGSKCNIVGMDNGLLRQHAASVQHEILLLCRNCDRIDRYDWDNNPAANAPCSHCQQQTLQTLQLPARPHTFILLITAFLPLLLPLTICGGLALLCIYLVCGTPGVIRRLHVFEPVRLLLNTIWRVTHRPCFLCTERTLNSQKIYLCPACNSGFLHPKVETYRMSFIK
jgi:hypothetical protein